MKKSSRSTTDHITRRTFINQKRSDSFIIIFRLFFVFSSQKLAKGDPLFNARALAEGRAREVRNEASDDHSSNKGTNQKSRTEEQEEKTGEQATGKG